MLLVGNPGVALYYKEFIKTIHERCGLAAWSLSHAGHVPVHPEKSIKDSGNKIHW